MNRPRPAVPDASFAAAVLGGAIIGGLLTGCVAETEDRSSLSLGEIEFSRPPGSGEPNLSLGADGRVLLTWIEPAVASGGGRPTGGAVRLAIRDADGSWSEPRTVHSSRHLFVNWADFPSSVEMADGTIAVHWLEKVAEATYAYHVNLALSASDGAQWSEPVRAHDDASPTEHGFVSIVPWGEGAALAWLDGRKMLPDPVTGERGPMSVRFRTLAPDGRFGPEIELDGHSCECCQTALANLGAGLLAAWRDRSNGEVRDIAVARGTGEQWTAPATLSADGWEIHGCPVNGPQLSGRGQAVASAWYTGAGGRPEVRVAFSRDGGATFDAPIRIDEGLPLGRVDIERLGDGSAVAVWLEVFGDAARVVARRVWPDGSMERAVTVTETASERSSGFPRMARLDGELLVAWTLAADDGGIRVRSLRLAP